LSEPTSVFLPNGGGYPFYMKVLIEMSPEQYELFVAECDIKSPEYSILKNAIVPREGNDGRVISLLCDKDEATQLLQAARQFYPDAAASIAKAIDQAGES
jgi:hypothetical protein